jgi:hypothetical protein
MKFRALWSQPSTSRVFFKTFFDFSKMDIFKMSKIENQMTFWNSSCQDKKNYKKYNFKIKTIHGHKFKKHKKNNFFLS